MIILYKTKFHIWPPIITGLLLLPVFFYWRLWPFGENTLAWCDLQQQVVPLWMQFSDMLRGDTSLLYSFKAAGGMDMWGVMLFFVSSPLSLVTAFFDKAQFLNLANVLTAVKLMLCAVGMSSLLYKRYPNLETADRTTISVCYAFSGFSMLFYQNSVWLDMAAAFPLLYMAFLAMDERCNGRLYCAMLVLSIVINYYLSYVVIIFLLIAAGTRCVFHIAPGKRGEYAARVGGYTALALALSSTVWLPSLIQVAGSARGTSVIDTISSAKLFAHLPTTLPFLCCSAVVFALAIFSFQGRLKSGKSCEVILAAIMIIPIFIEPVNLIWHTGSYQAFPVRYGFILITLICSLAAGALEGGTEIPANKKSAVTGLIAAVALTYALGSTLLYMRIDEISVYVRRLWGDVESLVYILDWAILLFGAGALVMALCGVGKLTGRARSVVLALLMAAQSLFFGAVFIGEAASSGSWLPFITNLESKITDDEFYRVKSEAKLFDVNLIGGLGYNTLAHYTSLTKDEYLHTIRDWGYSGYWMEVGSHGGTLITDALLRNRYVIASDDKFEKQLTQIYSNEGFQIYEEDISLPFGILSSADLSEISQMPELERPMVGQWVLSELSGEEAEFVRKLEPSGLINLDAYYSNGRVEARITDQGDDAFIFYNIEVAGKQILYFDGYNGSSTNLYESINAAVDIWVNGDRVQRNYPSQKSNGIVELGRFEDETVTVVITVKKNFAASSFGVFSLDYTALERLTKDVDRENLSVSGRRITGKINSQDGGEMLFICVPYDRGWNLKINGEKVDAQEAFGSFIAAPLKKGENNLVMEFFPVGMKVAAALTIISIPAALLFIKFNKKRKFSSNLEKMMEYTLLALASFALAAVSVIPVAIWAFA